MKLIPELPLLRRELTELANRRRTYVVRVLGAIVILLFMLFAYQQAISGRQARSILQLGGNPMLGIGGVIFPAVTNVLFFAIQLLMPAFCCAAIAGEKEANTIGTLLLTRLSSGTIILEKFSSRLVPMLTLILLTFPVLAFVFSLGGVDTKLLVLTTWLLFCECLLFGSIALLCSAWFSGVVPAFMASYVIMTILATMSYSLGLGDRVLLGVPSSIWQYELMFTGAGGLTGAAWTTFPGAFNPPDPEALILSAPTTLLVFFKALQATTPCLIFVAVTLLLCRFLLVRRAFVSRSSILLKIFARVDRFFHALNQRTTGGIELIADASHLPEDDPVAWRERTKKSLGKARYLFRILTVLMIPTVFVCTFSAIESAYRNFAGLYVLMILLWTLALLVTAVKGTTLFTSERSHQTLESLLACPLTGRELLDQKLAGMNRLMIVLALPVLTVNLMLMLVQVGLNGLSTRSLSSGFYPILSLWNVYLLLSITAWVAAAIGLRIHTQMKAIIATFAVMTAWIAVPIFIALLFSRQSSLPFLISMSLSPASVPFLSEIALLTISDVNTMRGGLFATLEVSPIVLACILTIMYSLVLVFLKKAIRSRVPGLLGRRETEVHISGASVEGSTRVGLS